MRCAIFLQDALGCHPIDLGHDGRETGLGRRLVTTLDGLHDLPDRRTHARTKGHVVRAAFDGLAGAFFCRLNVGQGSFRSGVGPRKRALLFGAIRGKSSR